MKINQNWELYYSKENTSIEDYRSSPSFSNVSIPAMFETELFRNGVLGDPYVSTNNWDYQAYEGYHQFYRKTFNSSKPDRYLRLNGVDTISEVFLNGQLIGKTDNCYLPFTFEMKGLKKRNNELVIHVLPSVVEGRKHDFSSIRQCAKYNYEALYIRKPASSFGWDILPRTPLGGIYKDVEIIDALSIIEDLYIQATEVSREKAVLNIRLKEQDGITFHISGKCGHSSFEENFLANTTIVINNPKLWTIRGYGKQNLYKITIVASKNGEVVETKNIEYGIRKIELKRTSTVSKKGCFEFLINNQKVFLLGSNWVPTEAIKHIDNNRAREALNRLVNLGCNAIRIWGGGTYETEEVYSLCDKLGIFIWQDFMMGCATYPQDEAFTIPFRKEAEYIVKSLRNHCSICLWAGDNENDLASAFWAIQKDDPNKNVITRKIIPEVLEKYDDARPYLPSSPYVDEYAYAHKTEQLSEDHLWGPRDYFKSDYYKNSYPYFTSETGYHGLNSLKSLNEFIKKPWPLFDDDGKPTKEYMCHGVSVKDDPNSPYAYRTRLMADQVKVLFKDDINNLEDFILASQISQAEAMKYFIEKMRRDTKRNGGIIWWNILDGWPQISDAVIDYYFNEKLACNYIRKSQQPLLLFIDENKDAEVLYYSSLTKRKTKVTYSITDAYTSEIIKEGAIELKKNTSKKFDEFDNDGQKRFLIIRYKDEKGNEYINTFHTNVKDIDFEKYKKVLEENKFFR